MNREFVTLWEKNKGKLEEYIKTTSQKECSSYADLVKAIINTIINKDVDTYFNDSNNYDVSRMTVIDNGDYQGTQLFLIPKNKYQPRYEDYVITYVEYGSCSGCDTLQAIREYTDGLSEEEQMKDYMELCLHLLQRMKKLSE